MNDCCVGILSINYGKWYCPVGKTPTECTYCSYCITNGCIKDDVYEIKENITCNCDCLLRDSHPHPEYVTCPVCTIEWIDVYTTAVCGTCKSCADSTPSSSDIYCQACSTLHKSCHKCGNKIKCGNDYIEDIHKATEEMVLHCASRIHNETPNNMINYYNEKIKMYNTMCEEMLSKYKDKNENEMWEFLIGEIRNNKRKI